MKRNVETFYKKSIKASLYCMILAIVFFILYAIFKTEYLLGIGTILVVSSFSIGSTISGMKQQDRSYDEAREKGVEWSLKELNSNSYLSSPQKSGIKQYLREE